MNDILSKNTFSKIAEEKIKNNHEMYIDAIINTCTEFNIEPEDCKKYLKGGLVSKLEAESVKNKLLITDSSSILDF